MTTFDAESFRRAMYEAPDRLFRHLKEALDKYMRRFAMDTMTDRASGGQGSGLHRRTGQLAQSFRHHVDGNSLKTLRGTVYTDSVYAGTQEFDADHVPRRRKYLTIPLSGNLTPAGVSRGDANLYRSRPTFLRPHPRGWIMFLKTGRRRGPRGRDPSIVPLFLLVRRVHIPGRLGFFKTWAKEAEEREEILMGAVDKALDGLGGGSA